MDRSYTAFISYRHKPLDAAVAAKLHQVIEGYRIPGAAAGGRKKLGLVFRDREELPASGDLNRDICDALDRSENLIVVCSPDTPGSRWVNNEITYFLEKHDRTHLFAVLAAGEPEDSFPDRLVHPDLDDPDFLVEPLAVDVRAESVSASVRKVRSESLRLFAGMLGVPYDSLARREQKRKMRRMGTVGGIAAAVLLGYAGFMMYSNRVISAKNEELENRNRTISEQKASIEENESRLLTDAARLEINSPTGEMRTALQDLTLALPDENDNRPYYALAESALMEAFDLFGAEESAAYRCTDIIEHRMPIFDFAYTGDGTRIWTLDRFSNITCYSFPGLEEQWQTNIWNEDLYYYDPVRLNNGTRMFLDEETNTLYAGGRGILAMDADTGILKWAYDPAESFSLSPDGTRIRTVALVGEVVLGEYALVDLDAATGEVLSETGWDGSETETADAEKPEPVLPDGWDIQISEEDSRQLLISRIFEMPNPAARQTLDLPVLETWTNDRYLRIGYREALTGKSIDLFAESYGHNYFQARVDTETGKSEFAEFPLEGNRTGIGSGFLAVRTADGTKAVVTRGMCDNLYLVDSTNGSVKIFWNSEEQQTRELLVTDGFSDHYYGSMDRIARQEDGSVLAAEVDRKNLLHIWKNGEEWISEPLPDSIQWQSVDRTEFGNYWYRTLAVSGHGQILLSDFAGSEDPDRTARIAVFDTGSRQWRFLADSGHGRVYRPVLFFHGSGLFAVLDDDSRIRVYDPEQPDPVRTLPMPVPAASVWGICLSEDDAYIAVVTADNQLGILDAENGEVKYWEIIQLGENELPDSPVLFTDPENRRLYVAFSGSRFPGKCIDLRSWQKLQGVEGLIAFCPETGKVLQIQNDWGILKTVPTTLELVDAAKSILEGI